MVLVDRIANTTVDTTRLPGWSFGDLKRQLAQQTLECWLAQHLDLPGVCGLRLLAERQRRDSAALLLVGTTANTPGTPRELVLHYARSERLLRAWWLPHDPFLPALARLATQPLAALAWQPAAVADLLAMPLILDRLAYNPGQRAILHVSAPATGQQLVLKIQRPAAFTRSLNQQTRLRLCGLAEQLAMPQLLAAAPAQHALLYQYVPGRSLDALQATLNSALEHQLARLLATIHAAAPGGLHSWQPAGEIALARPLLADLAQVDPASAHALDALLDQVAASLQPYARSYTQLIHGDLSAKNVLRQSQRRLAIIDWDSSALGPPEKDLATLLSRSAWRKQGGHRLIANYERLRGQVVDRTLINLLISHQRILKLCRRLLSGACGLPEAPAAIQSIAGQLAHNPWE